jgi:hypothetical protein
MQNNHKQKFRISRKRKLPFPHLFRRKLLFHFRFHFRRKNSVSVFVPQIFVFVSIFSFRFRFFAEKSESFRSTFIPTAPYLEEHTAEVAVGVVFFAKSDLYPKLMPYLAPLQNYFGI